MVLRLLLPPSVGAARAQARAELLNDSLKAELGEPVEVVVAANYMALQEGASRDAHLVWMTPTVCARLEHKLHAVYKCQRRGSTTYRSALVVRRDTFTRLEDLRGRHMTWVDPLSIGGHLLARAELSKVGLRNDRDFTVSFAGSYPDALAAVVSGSADATAVTVQDSSERALQDGLIAHGGRKAAKALRSLVVSDESPNDALVLTDLLDSKRAEALRERVFGVQGSRARSALCLALEAEDFVPAEPGEYARLKHLLD